MVIGQKYQLVGQINLLFTFLDPAISAPTNVMKTAFESPVETGSLGPWDLEFVCG